MTNEEIDGRVSCGICPHRCSISEGSYGICGARSNQGGVIRDENYGMTTSLSLDPIEKKPLARFHPGSTILSTGSYGCNLRCPFCQNSEISMVRGADAPTVTGAVFISPQELVERAKGLIDRGNIGLAFTYNEPLVGYEYVRDASQLSHEQGMLNVVVSNGYVNEGPISELLPLIDAINIDLKGFTEEFYRMVGAPGGLEVVKRTIALAAKMCHVEVTTLVIPGKNDSPEEMQQLSEWLASVDPEIPLHISRFFPSYHFADYPPTSPKTIHELAAIAEKTLSYVYRGNC